MNDKCSAKKAAIPNFFPTIFITKYFLRIKAYYCQSQNLIIAKST